MKDAQTAQRKKLNLKKSICNKNKIKKGLDKMEWKGNGMRRNAKENGAKEHAWISRRTGDSTGRQAGRQTDALTKKTLRYAPGLRGISFASGDRKGVSPAMPGTQQHSQPVRRAGSA